MRYPLRKWQLAKKESNKKSKISQMNLKLIFLRKRTTTNTKLKLKIWMIRLRDWWMVQLKPPWGQQHMKKLIQIKTNYRTKKLISQQMWVKMIKQIFQLIQDKMMKTHFWIQTILSQLMPKVRNPNRSLNQNGRR